MEIFVSLLFFAQARSCIQLFLLSAVHIWCDVNDEWMGSYVHKGYGVIYITTCKTNIRVHSSPWDFHETILLCYLLNFRKWDTLRRIIENFMLNLRHLIEICVILILNAGGYAFAYLLIRSI